MVAMFTPRVDSQTVTASVAAGNNPYAVAVNQVTNTIYVANYYGGNMTVNNSGTITVIDGATHASATLAAGLSADCVAVNPVTNTAYVGNFNSPFVTVVDGTTNAAFEIPVGLSTSAIAVNPATNKIYVAGAIVSVIDGVTNTATAIPVGQTSGPIAVNTVTNKIYVAAGNNVDVIDGDTGMITPVAVGNGPVAIAINTVTDKIYVANNNEGGPGSVTVIDGATNATRSVTVGSQPDAIAVNPVTNQVYVANFGVFGGLTGSGVTVIDGATYSATTLQAGSQPEAVVVNPVTNQVYVANFASSSVTVINGATNESTTVPVGPGPDSIAVNTTTNTVYTANSGGNTGTVTVINGAEAASVAPPARIINISARAQVGAGADVLIPGFTIAGSGAETLLIRGDGPALQQFGITGALAQPILRVLDGNGNLIASNTGWTTNSNSAQMVEAAKKVGAFAFASGSADSAVEVTLPAGSYTVQVSGEANTTGLALAEIYEISSTGTRLVNISARAQVGVGSDIVVLGFVIAGVGPEVMLVRADGPSLAQFGVAGVLAQPSLGVFDNTGDIIASNTGWGHSFEEDLIAGFAAAIGAFALPPGSPDSAQFVSLPQGAYTLQVSGSNGTTGVALAEAYEER